MDAFKELMKGARIAVKQCMNIKPNERVLIITDKNMPKEISLALDKAVKEAGAKSKIKIMKTLKRDGQEPPKTIAELMKTPNVLLLVTSKSLSHTQARRNAKKKGVRIASMPRIPVSSFINGGLTADYFEVRKLCDKILNKIKNSKVIKITSKNGTDLDIYVGKYKWDKDSGIYHNKGDFGNLPAGEVATAPIERTVNGILMIDKMGEYGENIKIKIENGLIKKIEGSELLKNDVKELGNKAKVVAELGIGCNPKAKVIGNILEDEKVLGTVHIAFGNNIMFGGKNNVEFHVDGIILKPTLIADNKILIENGKWMI